MATIDFVCIGIILLFCIIGLFRGFAKQLSSLFGWFLALIAAIVLTPICYKILFADDGALAGFRETFEGFFSFLSIAQVEKLSVEFGISSCGVLFARWVIMVVMILLLWIVITIVFKLFRLILSPFSFSGCHVGAFGRIIGAIFGLALGCAIVLALLGVLYALSFKHTAVQDLLDKLIVKDCFIDKYIYPIAVKIGDFLKSLHDVYYTTIIPAISCLG